MQKPTTVAPSPIQCLALFVMLFDQIWILSLDPRYAFTPASTVAPIPPATVAPAKSKAQTWRKPGIHPRAARRFIPKRFFGARSRRLRLEEFNLYDQLIAAVELHGFSLGGQDAVGAQFEVVDSAHTG